MSSVDNTTPSAYILILDNFTVSYHVVFLLETKNVLGKLFYALKTRAVSPSYFDRD